MPIDNDCRACGDSPLARRRARDRCMAGIDHIDRVMIEIDDPIAAAID
jgi:hypothetical protein